MKVIKDTLECIVERWDDPGDYPSNAGSCPLPSELFVGDVTGILVVEVTGADILAACTGNWDEGEIETETDPEIIVKKWHIDKWELGGDPMTMRLTLSVAEFAEKH